MTPEEEPIYVGIENPVEIRRTLLESSKNLIKILQENESRRQRRMQKQHLTGELKGTINEITQLMRSLKSQMPKVKMSGLPKKQAVIPERKITPIVMKPRPLHLSQSQKLEKELQDIESKLQRL